MRFSLRATFLLVFLGISLFSGVYGITCKRPTVGRYVVGKDGMECVALIKENCIGMKNKNTRMWRRGVNIRENCSKIRPMAAIATFSGPNNKYSGGTYRHSAIFSSCDVNGIWVFDQWNGSRGVRYRQLQYDDSNTQNDGSKYFTIIT